MNLPDAPTLYQALAADPRRLSELHRLTYRCAEHRCLLLDVVDVQGQPLVHQKRYKLSAALNAERSSADGRAKNTLDGENHWKPRTYWLQQSALALTDAEGATLDVQCDHVIVSLRPSQFERDWRTRHAREVRLRADGTRYTVG